MEEGVVWILLSSGLACMVSGVWFTFVGAFFEGVAGGGILGSAGSWTLGSAGSWTLGSAGSWTLGSPGSWTLGSTGSWTLGSIWVLPVWFDSTVDFTGSLGRDTVITWPLLFSFSIAIDGFFVVLSIEKKIISEFLYSFYHLLCPLYM